MERRVLRCHRQHAACRCRNQVPVPAETKFVERWLPRQPYPGCPSVAARSLVSDPGEWNSSGVFERYTESARHVVVLAQEEARTLKHNYVGTEHVLLGLVCEEEGLAGRVLASFEITVESARAAVVRIVSRGEETTDGQIPFTPRAKKVLELSLREALSLSHKYIGTEHILLGLVRENEGVAARILRDFDADPETIRNEVLRMLSGPDGQAPETSIAISSRAGPQVIDQAWFDGLGGVLYALTREIRHRLQRAPDTGDLLLALASAPDTLAGQALRELGADLDGLPGLVERIRVQARAADELAHQLQELTEAKEQAIKTVAELRARERELREQALARAAVQPDVLHEIRRQIGIPNRGDDPPQPPPPQHS
jgi:ATP-dependent Clp protease ATP-binding subunit ClpA